MWSLLLFAALSSGPSGRAGDASLAEVAAALKSAGGWRAGFSQRYLPEGFEHGSTDEGTVVVAPPLRLRFDYRGEDPRIFAVDGAVARLVDQRAATCDAVRLDRSTWGRLPLAALLDPAEAERAFVIESHGRTLRFTPRAPLPEVAELLVTVGADGLPSSIVVTDADGNRNEFAFTGWRRADEPSSVFFEPSLPGARPCAPPAG